MDKGQATLELLIGFSIALVIIVVAFVVLFTLFPSIFSGASTPSSTGFSGLRITGQGYLSSLGIFYLKFQNLLNENINIIAITMIASGIDQNASACTENFVPNLNFSECNFTVSLSSPFSAVIDVYYTPSNTSTHPKIEIVGSVSG